jgi:hypothetical protein
VADFIAFNEGRQVVETSGWPATDTVDLSTKAVGTGVTPWAATDVYSGRSAITGTGYAAKTQGRPTSTALGSMVFPTALSWPNGAATNWQNPCSIVASDGAKIICAWNLVPGGAARDMSQANTTLNVTPSYVPTNPP